LVLFADSNGPTRLELRLAIRVSVGGDHAKQNVAWHLILSEKGQREGCQD